MNLGFTCVILFTLRTELTRLVSTPVCIRKTSPRFEHLLVSLGGIPPLAGFFGKIYLFWAWQSGQYWLVLLGLVATVVSIYYYIRVVKMMVVKEPQMSDAVKNYPSALEFCPETFAGG